MSDVSQRADLSFTHTAGRPARTAGRPAPGAERPSPWTRAWTRPRVHRLNHAIILFLLATSLASYFFSPVGLFENFVDIFGRAYLMFLCTVMAHEGTHGHLGMTRPENDWWGRIALIPPMVPYVTFRKTHRMHHAKTNIPGEDPDLFIKPNRWYEVPLRSVAIPHYWVYWLAKRGWLTGAVRIELALTYVTLTAIYGTIAFFVGVERVLAGAGPSLLVVCLLLWYPFALRTHEGFSQGTSEARSHNYYGRIAFWFSLGLGMHRAHHQQPGLAWIQLLPLVERGPVSWRPFLRDRRDRGEREEPSA